MIKLSYAQMSSTPVGAIMRGLIGPILVDLCLLLAVCTLSVGFSSASDLGRPGSAYAGYIVVAIAAGAMTAYHSSLPRRCACFVVLLIALVGVNSEKNGFEGFRALRVRARIKSLQAEVEQLASAHASASDSQPTATP